MAAATRYVFPIEQVYEPHELQTATAGRRLAAYAIDTVLFFATFIIGWLIWLVFTAPAGQTPGKRMVGLYVIRDDGTRAGGGYTWLREILVKQILFVFLSALSGGIISLLGSLWLLWDRDRQCLWDKITSTHVGYSPEGFVPQTLAEQRGFGGVVRTRQPGQQVTLPVAEVPATPGANRAATSDSAGPSQPSPAADRLRELQRLREEGLITAEEYEARRIEVVKDL